MRPETPEGGEPLYEGLPDPDAAFGYVRTFAARFGVEGMSPPPMRANTRRALAIARHARDAGRLEAYRDAALDAYWRRGAGLESDADLAALAREAGLDPAAALAAARDPAVLAGVDEERRRALEAGIASLPTFDFGRVRVVGCQPYEALAEAALGAGARRRGPA